MQSRNFIYTKGKKNLECLKKYILSLDTTFFVVFNRALPLSVNFGAKFKTKNYVGVIFEKLIESFENC